VRDIIEVTALPLAFTLKAVWSGKASAALCPVDEVDHVFNLRNATTPHPPTLSPWEREQAEPRNSVLLPSGEGQDEGRDGQNKDADRNSKCDRHTRNTLSNGPVSPAMAPTLRSAIPPNRPRDRGLGSSAASCWRHSICPFSVALEMSGLSRRACGAGGGSDGADCRCDWACTLRGVELC